MKSFQRDEYRQLFIYLKICLTIQLYTYKNNYFQISPSLPPARTMSTPPRRRRKCNFARTLFLIRSFTARGLGPAAAFIVPAGDSGRFGGKTDNLLAACRSSPPPIKTTHTHTLYIFIYIYYSFFFSLSRCVLSSFRLRYKAEIYLRPVYRRTLFGPPPPPTPPSAHTRRLSAGTADDTRCVWRYRSRFLYIFSPDTTPRGQIIIIQYNNNNTRESRRVILYFIIILLSSFFLRLRVNCFPYYYRFWRVHGDVGDLLLQRSLFEQNFQT